MVGLELQPQVAEAARQNLVGWGLAGRASAVYQRLPEPEHFCEQLRQAGLKDVQAKRLTPGESFYAFLARV